VQISGNTPALNTLRFSLTSESQRESLLGSMREGQTIQARVVDELSTGRWAIRFMGHTLIAESRLSLRPGQVVETRVHELGPPLTLSISGRPGSEEAAVRDALGQLGLKEDPTNRAILAALIRNGLPVDRREAQAIRDFLTGLGDNPLLDNVDELVDRLLFLRGKGIPVTPDTLAAFWSSAPSGAMGSLLEGLADLLRAMDKRIPENTRVSLDNILKALTAGSGKPTPAQLKALLHRIGFDLEGQIASGKPVDTLKSTLLKLLASSEGLSSQEHGQISDIVRFLNTLQAKSLPGDGSDPLHLQIPFVDGHTVAAADIQISRGGEDGSVDPNRLSLSVSVCLSALGDIQVDLSSYDGVNTCSIRVANEEAHKQVTAEIGDLSGALTRSGYPVPNIRVRIETENPPAQAARPTLGVDFKA
jgi:hypothetical protein